MKQLALDGQGYPTEETLQTIEKQEVHNLDEVRSFIDAVQGIWWMPSFGFIWDGKAKLILHTGGWSGNESIIYALRHNIYFWRFWKAHFTGGHYHFEIK